MLLIDGVKYELWIPSNEDELEQIIIEHAQDIFGENSIYFDKKQKLSSLAGVGSIPDGLAILFGGVTEWHIVEVELSSHDLHGHIISQVSKFISGIENLDTQRKMRDVLYNEINSDDSLQLRVQQAIGLNEIHKFLSDLISKPPALTVIIEKDTEELRGAIKTLAYPKEIRVVEFRTFIGEGVEGLAVHAHLFEPLYKVPVPTESQLPFFSPATPKSSFVVVLQAGGIKSSLVKISQENMKLFPSEGTMLLETNIGAVESKLHKDYKNAWLGKGLAKWFKAHPELKEGDKLRITVIEPMKKYRLEIVK